MCELHGSCARYAAIDGAHMPSGDFMALCMDGHGGRPKYIPIRASTGSTLDYAAT